MTATIAQMKAWAAPGLPVSLALLTGALLVLAWISLPAWYWAVSDPAAHAGLTNVGMTVVDTPAKAVVVSAVGLALVPVVLLLARGGATTHAALAARVLGTVA